MIYTAAYCTCSLSYSTVKLVDAENCTKTKNSTLSYTQPELWQFHSRIYLCCFC